jgi:hypothetical protein
MEPTFRPLGESTMPPQDKPETRDAAVPSPSGSPATDAPPRALLYYWIIVVQLAASAVSGAGYVLEDTRWYLGGMFVWLLWFLLIFQVVRPAPGGFLERHARGVRRGAFTIFVTLFTLGILEVVTFTVIYPIFASKHHGGQIDEVLAGFDEVFQYNDGDILVQQAGENLLAGKNPYAHANIIEGLIAYHGAYDRVTPLQVGRFKDDFPYPSLEAITGLIDEAVKDPSHPPAELVSGVSYPAGSFLLPAPFLAAGIRDIRIVYAILVAGGLAYAVWAMPGRRRRVFAGGVLVSLEFWNSIAAGDTSITCFPLLLVAWLTLGKHNRASVLFMGLAVATKQTAWFVLPFYLVWLYRSEDRRQIPAALGIIAAVFAAANLPFIIADPGLWLSSVLSPMADPVFPLGVGVVNLVTSGLVSNQSSLPFTVLELAALAGGIIWYYRNCRRMPHAGLILAVLPLFFAWRSLWPYFFYVGMIAFAGVCRGHLEEKATGCPAAPGA